MCGPADFAALNTCVTHLAGLSAAGLTAYSACKAAALRRELRRRQDKQRKRALPNGPGQLAAEGSNGPANA